MERETGYVDGVSVAIHADPTDGLMKQEISNIRQPHSPAKEQELPLTTYRLAEYFVTQLA